jgi:hypothetical protein
LNSFTRVATLRLNYPAELQHRAAKDAGSVKNHDFSKNLQTIIAGSIQKSKWFIQENFLKSGWCVLLR